MKKNPLLILPLLVALLSAQFLCAATSLEGGDKDKRRKAKTATQAAPAPVARPTATLEDSSLMRNMAMDGTTRPADTAIATSSTSRQGSTEATTAIHDSTSARPAATSQAQDHKTPDASPPSQQDDADWEGTASLIMGVTAILFILTAFFMPYFGLLGILMGIPTIVLACLGLGNRGKDRERAKAGLALGIQIVTFTVIGIILLIRRWNNLSFTFW